MMNVNRVAGRVIGPGIADPHIRPVGDTAFLYCGVDAEPTAPSWVMPEWRVYASPDLERWTHVGTIRPEHTILGAGSIDCWALDACHTDHGTYVYYSDRHRGIGVARSDGPAGPFVEARGTYLVEGHDPTIVDDPRGNRYIVWGSKETSYRVARLAPSMTELAEPPRPIEVRGRGWEEAPPWMDKNFVFRLGDVYYLTWGGDYATSDSVYGPYEWVGRLGEGYGLGPYAHGSIFEFGGRMYHTWCRYIDSRYKYRETYLTSLTVSPSGELTTDVEALA